MSTKSATILCAAVLAFWAAQRPVCAAETAARPPANEIATPVLSSLDSSALHGEHKYAHIPTADDSMPPLARATAAYDRGLIADAFNLLLNAHEATHDIRYLEFTCELADRQVDSLAEQYAAHYALLKPSLTNMAQFDAIEMKQYERWDSSKHHESRPLFPLKEFFGGMQINPIFYAKGLPATNIAILNEAYGLLTGQAHTNAVVAFLPALEIVKRKMMAVEARVVLLISNPDSDASMERLVQLERTIKGEREKFRKLRTGYITDNMVSPRIVLGRLLVYAMKNDQEHVGTIAPGVNTHWMEKLEILFNNDNGVFIAQSEQSTRLEFQKLVKLIKSKLGQTDYKEFQAALELLSNNKDGGSESWWPETER